MQEYPFNRVADLARKSGGLAVVAEGVGVVELLQGRIGRSLQRS